MRLVCILLLVVYLETCIAKESLTEMLHPSIQKVPSDADNINAEGRKGRQLKWLQPASYILSNIKKPLQPGDESRFFKIIQKGSSVSSIEMLAQILKQALEDFSEDFETFSDDFEHYIDNEVRRVSTAPSVAQQFSNAASASLSTSLTNINMATQTLLDNLVNVVQDLLGIDLSTLVPTLTSPLVGPGGIIGGGKK